MAGLMWAAIVAATAGGAGSESGRGVFSPGATMRDTAGNIIDAHGGGFLADGDTIFWYGSARTGTPRPASTWHNG